MLNSTRPSTIREQKRHIGKNHIKCLKAPWMAGCPLGHQAGVPAGRPLFVPPDVPETPGRCPEDFSLVDVPFPFLNNDPRKNHTNVKLVRVSA